MVEVLVIMHGAISYARTLSETWDHASLFCLCAGLADSFKGKRATEEAFVLLCATWENAYRSARLWTSFFRVVVRQHFH